MTLGTAGGHGHHARSFRGGEVFGCAGDGGRCTAIKQSNNQTIKQSSKYFYHRGTRGTIECTEKHGFWRFAQAFNQTSREAQPLAYSVDSNVLPFSSGIKTF